MGIVLGLATIIAIGAAIYGIFVYVYHMSYNGDPADYYRPYRLLTDDEVAGLKHQFPQEIFRPEIYLIENEPLMTKSISSYGAAAGGYSYNTLGGLKVDIFYLGTVDIINALNQRVGDRDRYLVIRGKRKNYVVDINGVNFFNQQKESLAWFDCWQKAYNASPTEKKHIRILGQRQATKKERATLTKCHYQDYPPSAWAIGFLLFLPLLLILLMVNLYGSNLLSAITLIILSLAIIYCFFIHSKLYPYPIYAINIIEGKIHYDDSKYYISVGDLDCFVQSPIMMDKIKASSSLGKIRAVELTPRHFVTQVINIEGISHLNDYWLHRVPKSYYMFYLISALASLPLLLWLYFTQIQYYPYDFAGYTTHLISFYTLSLYVVWALSYSAYFIVKNGIIDLIQHFKQKG